MKTRKWISVLLTLVLVLTLFAACGGSSKSTAEEFAMDAAEAPAAMENGSASLTGSTSTGSSAIPEDRKWIITVDMSAETENLDEMLAALDERINAMDGYVEDQNIYNGSTYSERRYRSANLTIRVPAADVDNFTEEVSGIANVVRTNKNLEDVTLSYVDTESRKAALEVERDRLLELMEQAETMADLLEIEARLTDVRYQLESAASKLRTYDNQINYATIYLNIEEVQEYTPVKEQTVWERISEGFVSSLKGLGDDLLDLLVWVLANSPYLVVYGVVITLIVILVRKTGKRKASKKNPPPKAE